MAAKDPDLDGDVDDDDVDLWLSTYNQFDPRVHGTLRGDLDLNLAGDIVDFGIIGGNFGQVSDIFGGDLALTRNSTVVKNGIVDIEDVGIFAETFERTPESAGASLLVPEPVRAEILLIGG